VKRCTRCGEMKPLEDFHVQRKASGTEYPVSKCKPCLVAYNRERRDPDRQREYKRRYAERHPERVREQRRARYQREDKDLKREQARAWRAENPERIRAYARNEDRRWARLLRSHGITRAEYEELYRKQKGQCPICERALPTGIVRKGEVGLRPHVDHCHVTGKVRGILCGPCNQALGLLDEDRARFARAARYLRS